MTAISQTVFLDAFLVKFVPKAPMDNKQALL